MINLALSAVVFQSPVQNFQMKIPVIESSLFVCMHICLRLKRKE